MRPAMLRLSPSAVLLLSLVACQPGTGAPAGTHSGPIAEETLSPSALRFPSASIQPKEPAGGAAATTVRPSFVSSAPPLSPEERSEAFWDPLSHYGHFMYNFDSLGAMINGSDLVVRGRIVEVRQGREVVFPDDVAVVADLKFIIATVAVDEVLKGDVQTRTPGTLEIELWLPQPTMYEQVRANVPGHDHLFFLLNVALESRRWDQEPNDGDEHTYALTNLQGILRNIDGVTRGLDREEPEAFSAALEDDPFEEVVDRARSLAETAGP